MSARSRGLRVMHVRDGVPGWRVDRVAEEEPLELRIDGRPLTVTMRTPGDDFDLALGFLLAEGLIDDAGQVREIRTCAGKSTGRHNVLEISLAPDAPGAAGFTPRPFTTTSACGLCGSESIAAVRAGLRWDVATDSTRVTGRLLTGLPDALRAQQRAFDSTGGLHAAALFGGDGRVLCVREDVGRHNAFDKVVGWAATARLLPLQGHMILASGRASFELTQKALGAGIPVLCAVSAPSSLAVELARAAGMTLVAFLRGTTFNVYSGHARVVGDTAADATG